MPDINKINQALGKISDEINEKRKKELIAIYSNRESFDYVRNQKELSQYSKSKVWRRVANIPIEVDQLFTKLYGKDYYKEKDFFTKHHPEWSVNKNRNI